MQTTDEARSAVWRSVVAELLELDRGGAAG
jgi:hypothetical protein